MGCRIKVINRDRSEEDADALVAREITDRAFQDTMSPA
jgi:hypothetical protein